MQSKYHFRRYRLSQNHPFLVALVIEEKDENGKVLGAYLYLKCTSGNCDRYKGY